MAKQPPSGGCVLKHHNAIRHDKNMVQPPSGGCVLKQKHRDSIYTRHAGSRLRAAVC